MRASNFTKPLYHIEKGITYYKHLVRLEEIKNRSAPKEKNLMKEMHKLWKNP